MFLGPNETSFHPTKNEPDAPSLPQREVMAPQSHRHKMKSFILGIIQFTLNSEIKKNKMNLIFLLFIFMTPLKSFRIANGIGGQRSRESLKMLLSNPSGIASTRFIKKIKLILRQKCIRRYGRFWKQFCH